MKKFLSFLCAAILTAQMALPLAASAGSPVDAPHTHTGGTATCTERPVCELCGQRYGEALGHDWGPWIAGTNADGQVIEYRVCRRNGAHREERIPADGGNTGTDTQQQGKAIITFSKGKVVIPSTISDVTGKVYAVTQIKGFSKNTNVSKVEKAVLGKNVTTLGAYAFSGCKSLKVLKIETTGQLKINRRAFSGLSNSPLQKLQVNVNKEMSSKAFAKLKQAFVKSGLAASNIKKVKIY